MSSGVFGEAAQAPEDNAGAFQSNERKAGYIGFDFMLHIGIALLIIKISVYKSVGARKLPAIPAFVKHFLRRLNVDD